MYFRKSFLHMSSVYFRKNVKNFRLKSKQDSPSPTFSVSGSANIFDVNKNSQEIQIFGKAFRGISYILLIFHLIKSAQLCVFSQVISAHVKRLFS
jgi:hypothetical protein